MECAAHRYRIEGKVNIPENRRNEFNDAVFDIFKACGIRKLETLTIDGNEAIVVSMPKADQDGIVSFDYSIFDKLKREISTYDMNTCELHLAECGYSEFGLAMNLIMTMQEAYTEGHCYLMKDDKVCSVDGYATLVEQITGYRLSFHNRENIWDTGKHIELYKIFARDDEDEFIEFWSDQELKLSEEMKTAIQSWKDRYCTICNKEIDKLNMEKGLWGIIQDLDQVWHCRYLDKEFVDEFLQHKEDYCYKKAVLLYREILETDTDYFPELTRGQSTKWMIRNYKSSKERLQFVAYQSLLVNHQHRKEILGF